MVNTCQSQGRQIPSHITLVASEKPARKKKKGERWVFSKVDGKVMLEKTVSWPSASIYKAHEQKRGLIHE